MFEDIAKNLVVPYELGMTTTLIVPQTLDPFREEFEQEAVQHAAYRLHHGRSGRFPEGMRGYRTSLTSLDRIVRYGTAPLIARNYPF